MNEVLSIYKELIVVAVPSKTNCTGFSSITLIVCAKYILEL